MVTPNTYVGYDKDGQQICSCPATDANTYINPEEVKAGIENVISVVSEEMTKVSKALQDVAPDADTAVIVQGTKMTETIEQTCDALGSLSGTFGDSISGLYDQAMAVHDKLQNQANQEARSAVSSTSGVVRVSP